MNASVILIIWTVFVAVVCMIDFFIGYYLGRKSVLESPTILDERSKQVLKNVVVESDLRVGVINRPTQTELIKRQNPKIRESEDAMRESLDKLHIK